MSPDAPKDILASIYFPGQSMTCHMASIGPWEAKRHLFNLQTSEIMKSPDSRRTLHQNRTPHEELRLFMHRARHPSSKQISKNVDQSKYRQYGCHWKEHKIFFLTI